VTEPTALVGLFQRVGSEELGETSGIWNQFSTRDAESLRRIVTSNGNGRPFLVSPNWEAAFYPTCRRDLSLAKFPSMQRIAPLAARESHPNQTLTGEQIELPAAKLYCESMAGARKLMPYPPGAKPVSHSKLKATAYL